MPEQPPVSRRGDVVDVLHGEAVADPYRWLEDTWSAGTAEWVAAQNRYTATFLDQMTHRDAIRARITEFLDVTVQGAPHRRGSRWFFTRKDGLADQPVLVVADGPDESGRILLDPNTLSADGTSALSAWAVDESGTRMAYAVSEAGSDWQTWRVRDVESGDDLDDVLIWSKFSTASWLTDGGGFFYGAFDPPATDGETFLETSEAMRLQLHRLGCPQAEDEVVYVDPDPEIMPEFSSTDDGRWLVIELRRGTHLETVVRVKDMSMDGDIVTLVPEPSAHYRLVGSQGSRLFFLTDAHAPRRRLVAIDAEDPSDINEILAEGPDLLADAKLVGGRILCHYLHDASSALSLLDLDGGRVEPVAIPGCTTVTGRAGTADDGTCFVTLASFTDPGSVLAIDVATGETTTVAGTNVELPDLVTERVHATSADGTEIPLFLIHRTDATQTGEVPALLYGYGGFDVPIVPTFNAGWLTWVDRGGLLAVANLRGGGEFGSEWYDAGRLANKQNVFDDFAGCARWLASSGWTRADRIAATGRSNGGLLAGAALTQHPELFGAVLPEVGVLDLLRYHLFTIGWAWMSDYGDPAKPEEYPWVRAYSPLHNVTPGTTYPPVLITTGDHDDRVVPGHSFKFAATLQAAQGGTAPILIRVDVAAGHGAGKPTSKLIDERTDVIAFAEAALAKEF